MFDLFFTFDDNFNFHDRIIIMGKYLSLFDYNFNYFLFIEEMKEIRKKTLIISNIMSV